MVIFTFNKRRWVIVNVDVGMRSSSSASTLERGQLFRLRDISTTAILKAVQLCLIQATWLTKILGEALNIIHWINSPQKKKPIEEWST